MLIKAELIFEVMQGDQFTTRKNLADVSDFDLQVGVHDFLHQMLAENGILHKEVRLAKYTNGDS